MAPEATGAHRREARPLWFDEEDGAGDRDRLGDQAELGSAPRGVREEAAA